MVKETRIVVTPGDVLCVRITCPRCQNAVIMKLGSEEQIISDRCPLCSHFWTVTGGDYKAVAIGEIQSLLSNLRRLAQAAYVELEFQDTEQRT